MLDINAISFSVLLFILLITIGLGFLEIYFHNKSIKNIPIRIHVNGIRGKSSVVRLIASGLREANIKTFAKTTGTTPCIINNEGKVEDTFASFTNPTSKKIINKIEKILN